MNRPVFALGIAVASAIGASHAQAYNLLPLWESRHVAEATTFYTTYLNDHASALDTDGHEDHGVTAWVACSDDTLNGPNGEISYKGSTAYPDTPTTFPNDWITPSRWRHGYHASMDFSCAQPAGAIPMYSMWGGAPYYDHFYTTSVTEFNARKAEGYMFGRVEGYLFTTQVTGSVPLYRLSTGMTTPNHDREHRLIISTVARTVLLNAGWQDDGIMGYVFATNTAATVGATQYTGTFNGVNVSPTTTVNVPIRNVVPTTSTITLGGDSRSIEYGAYASNTTTRPAGAVWQNVTFDLYTGTLFSPGTTLDHMPVYLHYASTSSRTALSFIPPYDGVALVFAPSTSCPGAPTGGGQLMLEIGQAFGGLRCGPNLASVLQPNTWYTISYSLSDSASVRINVNVKNTGAAVTFLNGSTTYTESLSGTYTCPTSVTTANITPNTTYCANPYNVRGFPAKNTGYTWFPIVNGTSNTTARLANTKVRWLNSSLVPL